MTPWLRQKKRIPAHDILTTFTRDAGIGPDKLVSVRAFVDELGNLEIAGVNVALIGEGVLAVQQPILDKLSFEN